MTVRTRFAAMLTMWTSILAINVAAQTSPTEMTRRAVVTDKAAYIAMPPELVAEPVVTQLSVSGGRRYALAQRMKRRITADMLAPDNAAGARPDAEISLVLWDARAHLSTTVWRAAAGDMTVEQVTWLPKAEVAYVQVQQAIAPNPGTPQSSRGARQLLLRIDAVSARAEVIDLGDRAGADMLELIPSPTLPLTLVKFTRLETNPDGTVDLHAELVLLDDRGQFGANVDLPKKSWTNDIEWSDAGEPLVQVAARSADKRSVTTSWTTMNVRTGDLTPLANAPAKPQDRPGNIAKPRPGPALPLRLKTARVPVKEEETVQSAGLLWLEGVTKSEQQRTLLSSDSSGGELMARSEMVLFQSQGAVWAVPLLPMDLAAYLAMKQKADRIAVMNRAKQAALALLMFTQDNDETLPSGDGLIDNLSPYANDPSIFDGFNYTYPGGALSDIANPAQTVLGTMNGPGGQVIIYSDGHVRWQ